MEKKVNKSSFAAIFSICAVMYSAYVGPGFASGTQTVSYFLNKGWIGVFVGPLVAGRLCFIFNILLFEINRIYTPKTYREAYNNIYRAKPLQLFFGTFKELQVIVVVLIALSADLYHRHFAGHHVRGAQARGYDPLLRGSIAAGPVGRGASAEGRQRTGHLHSHHLRLCGRHLPGQCLARRHGICA